MPPLGERAELATAPASASMAAAIPFSMEDVSAAAATFMTAMVPGSMATAAHGVSGTSDAGHARSNKSKRKAAALELLERKASKQRLDPTDSTVSAQPRSFIVNACDSACCAASAAAASWCSIPVAMPSLDWPAILTAISASHAAAEAPRALPGGVDVHLVERHAALAPALAALRASAADGVVAIDLEWRPDYRPGSNNKVALIQLATATACVLVRACRLGFNLPAALRHLFSDPTLTFVAFSWDSCDEGKMVSSFGAGRSLFSKFIDLQAVAGHLGYAGIGLAALTARVLGVTLPKSRSVSRSDWQRPRLSTAQVQYAALDALVTGCVFRGLRLWHASPSPCAACKKPFGMEILDNAATPSTTCLTCKKDCRHVQGLLSHVKSTGHESWMALCDACGRVSPA